MDEVRVWDHVMTPSEVLAAQTIDTSSTTPGLFASFSFDLTDNPFADEIGNNDLSPTSPSDVPALVPASGLELIPIPSLTDLDMPLLPRPLTLPETFGGGRVYVAYFTAYGSH